MNLKSLERLKRANEDLHGLFNLKPAYQKDNRIFPNELDQITFTQKSTNPECLNCSELRRQLIRQTQETYKLTNASQQIQQKHKQYQALNELYQLKCQEVQILARKLRQSQQEMADIKNRMSEFSQKSVLYLESVLSQNSQA